MAKVIRVTISYVYTPEPKSYKDIEWPPDSGQRKDLMTIEEIADYENHYMASGDIPITEAIDFLPEGTVFNVSNEVIETYDE